MISNFNYCLVDEDSIQAISKHGYFTIIPFMATLLSLHSLTNSMLVPPLILKTWMSRNKACHMHVGGEMEGGAVQ